MSTHNTVTQLTEIPEYYWNTHEKYRNACERHHMKKSILALIYSACIKGSLGVRDSQKLPWDFQKSMPESLGLPTFKDI